MYSLIILIASLNGQVAERIEVVKPSLLECNNAKVEILKIEVPQNQSVIVKCVKN